MIESWNFACPFQTSWKNVPGDQISATLIEKWQRYWEIHLECKDPLGLRMTVRQEGVGGFESFWKISWVFLENLLEFFQSLSFFTLSFFSGGQKKPAYGDDKNGYTVWSLWIYLERHSEGNADGQVGKDPQEPVGQWPLEAEPVVVSNLVDGQHQGVVDHTAETVGSQHYHWPWTVLKMTLQMSS